MSLPIAAQRETAALRRIGQTLNGKWYLQRLLGVGGVSAVYAAVHRNGSEAAIKVFQPAFAQDEEMLQRFMREGSLANLVRHPGVVRVFDDDVDEEEGCPYLVMELVDGVSLQQRMTDKGPLSPTEVLEIVSDLLEILIAAHGKGVVHRDLKPENIIITPTGQLRLLDFGIARALDAGPSSTLVGMPLGTPAFMAPELAMGKLSEVDGRTDLFAVGAMMFFLLTRKYVHEGTSSQELVVQAAWHEARKLRDVWPQAPPSLATIVDRACEREPESRFENAAVMLAAVQAALASLRSIGSSSSDPSEWHTSDGGQPTLPSEIWSSNPAKPVSEVSPTRRSNTPGRRRWLAVVAACGLVVFGVFGGWWAAGGLLRSWMDAPPQDRSKAIDPIASQTADRVSSQPSGRPAATEASGPGAAEPTGRLGVSEASGRLGVAEASGRPGVAEPSGWPAGTEPANRLKATEAVDGVVSVEPRDQPAVSKRWVPAAAGSTVDVAAVSSSAPAKRPEAPVPRNSAAFTLQPSLQAQLRTALSAPHPTETTSTTTTLGARRVAASASVDPSPAPPPSRSVGARRDIGY